MLQKYFNDNFRKILLLRHGELDTGDRKLYVGQADVPLSETGVQQAETWARVLQKISIGRIIASDLSRCAVTAGIIAQGKQMLFTPRPEWREISFGLWDGRDFEEVKREYPAEVAQRYDNFVHDRPPEGENFMDLKVRIVRAFNELLVREEDGHVLVVTHAGVMRTLLAHLTGMPDRHIFHLFQDFSCLNIIDTQAGEFRHVRAINLVCGNT